MIKYTGDVIVKMLENAGIKRIWGITGDSANFITAAISKSKLQFMHVRHEESGAFAAASESKATGKLSVCMGSCGPGSLHLINGLYEANTNGTPVLCIATHILKNEIGFNYIQETDPKLLFSGCSKYCAIVQSPEQLPRIMLHAMQSAISLKGVATIIISGDISSQEYTGGNIDKFIPQYPSPQIFPTNEDLFMLASLINKYNEILIIGGEGCIDANTEIMEVAKRANAAIAWTFGGKEYLEYNNPFPIGIIGKLGTKSVNEAIRSSDLIIQLGCSLSLSEYKTRGLIVQVGINEKTFGTEHRIDYAFRGKVKDTMAKLIPLINTHCSRCYVEEVTMPYLNRKKQYENLCKQAANSENSILSEYVFCLLNKKIASDACICSDTGTALILTQWHIQATKERRFFQSYKWGSMGNGLPFALGVKACFPEREVIAICGDGGLSMLLGELLTVIQLNLPVKIILLNNGKLDYSGLDFIENGLKPIHIDLYPVNFADVVKTIGFETWHIEKAENLNSAIDEWLNSSSPAFLEVKVASITDAHLANS
ncbi:MAG: thiamine pyrophosphate-dependent enzyme [Bacteroidales bacterium]